MTLLSRWPDFGFETVEVSALSTAGTPYRRRVPFGMPKLPPQVLSTPFYLYSSVADAKAGEKFGGTGFFVGIPTGLPPDNPHQTFLYGITNWHVAVRDGASVIRVNTVGGGVDIFNYDPSEWSYQPKGHDLAVIPINDAQIETHDLVPMSTNMFIDRKKINDWGIGPGDDIFMLGRFIDHDGAQNNVPAARFGHISTMPQPIPQETGANNLESFILDLHSRTGYSGSPVFVYRTHGSDLSQGALNVGAEGGHFLLLLGIHWGQFPELWEIKSGVKPTAHSVPLTGNERYVKGMSGMTLAIPAWAIKEILDMPKFKEAREKSIDLLRPATSPVAESEPSATADSPSHKEDFMSLLNEAAKKRPQAD